MSMYPDNLLYYLKKLQGYSRNNVKVLPLTSTTSGGGQIVQFKLPHNLIVDLSSWTVHGMLAVAAVTQEAQFGRDASSIVRQMSVSCSGHSIQVIDNYNLIWQALKQSIQNHKK